MAKHRHDDQTPDLFAHAKLFPVETPQELPRAIDFNTRMAAAISKALKQAGAHGMSREDVARRMTEILDAENAVTVHMVNAYTAQSRETHTISLVRFKALVRATGCTWLWKEALDGDGLTLMEGEEAIHAQISYAETQKRALEDEIRQLKARAPLRVSTELRR